MFTGRDAQCGVLNQPRGNSLQIHWPLLLRLTLYNESTELSLKVSEHVVHWTPKLSQPGVHTDRHTPQDLHKPGRLGAITGKTLTVVQLIPIPLIPFNV